VRIAVTTIIVAAGSLVQTTITLWPLGAALPRLAAELLQNFPHPEAPRQPR
jgi:hypothetical protein